MNSKHIMVAGALVWATAGCSGAPDATATERSAAMAEESTAEAREEPAEAPTPQEPENLAGGWAEGDVEEDAVREAAEFAVQEQARVSGDRLELVSIESVAQQVVAGMNYRLGLNITRNGNPEQATAVVFVQPWTNTTRLTSFHVGEEP